MIFLSPSSLRTPCWRSIFFSNVLRKTAIEPSRTEFKAAYGKAFHIALARYYRDGNKAEAIREAVEYFEPFYGEGFQSLPHLVLSLKSYFNHHSPEEFQNCKVEFEFAIPLLKLSLDEALVIHGYIDLAATVDGIWCLVDHKTTAYSSKYFFDQYEFDLQILCYLWAWMKLRQEETVPKFILNGIFISDSKLEAVKFNGVHFDRREFIYRPDQIKDFERYIMQKAKTFKSLYDAGTLQDHPDFACCSMKKQCQFFKVCTMPIDSWDDVMSVFYQTKKDDRK